MLVGIPTYQEATGIQAAVRRVDEAIGACGLDAEFQLVNMDNRSPDGTAALFRSTPTQTPKISLHTPHGVTGKGENWRELFRYAVRVGACAISFDADLQAVPDDWVSNLAAAVTVDDPVLAIPLYARSWNDGSLTNHVVAPLVLAGTGHPVRQPIGGDFAFSTEFMRQALSWEWPTQSRGFGTDIFLVLAGLRIGVVRQVPLSTGKHHPWRSSSAADIPGEFASKFHQVVATLFAALPRTPPPGPLPSFPAGPSLDPSLERGCDLRVMAATAARAHSEVRRSPAYAQLSGRTHGSDRPRMGDTEWAAVLARSLDLHRAGLWDEELWRALLALFFCRVAAELPLLAHMTAHQIDARVGQLAAHIRSVAL